MQPLVAGRQNIVATGAITYIRTEMGFTAWNALFSTPTHPEYPAAHAVLSAATAKAINRPLWQYWQLYRSYV